MSCSRFVRSFFTAILVFTSIDCILPLQGLSKSVPRARIADPGLASSPLLCFAFYLQVKIMTDQELLGVACEQFLGKNVQEIKAVVLQTLEGHLRSILGKC